MYKQIKQLSINEIMTELLPSLAISITLAEVFFKLGSFTLECILFLGTFVAVSFMVAQVKSLLSR